MKKLVSAILPEGLFMANVNAKTLVAYFSATGNTKRLSQTVASALGADIRWTPILVTKKTKGKLNG